MTELTTDTAPLPALKPLSLRANFTWTLAGNVVYAGCSWAMLVVLAKLGTPEIVGQFALGLAVTAPIILFANLQLRAIQATDARREYLFRDYFGLRLVMLTLALVVIGAIIFLSSYQMELALTVAVIGIGKAIDSISDVIYGALQQQEKMDRIAVSLVLKGILSLILLALGMALTHSVLWASVGWALASLIVVLGYDVWSGVTAVRSVPNDGFAPRFAPRLMLRLSWLALPLGLTMLLISLNTNIPRYFVEHYAGASGLGIFAAVAYLMTVGSVVISALGQSASPRLARHYAAGDKAGFQSLLLRLVGMGAALGAAGVALAVIAGKPLLSLLYKPEYAQQNDVFVWLMVAAGIGYVASFFGYGVTAARYFRAQPVLFTICAVCTAALCAILVPSSSVRGAAWAIVLASVIQLGLMMIYITSAVRKLKQQ